MKLNMISAAIAFFYVAWTTAGVIRRRGKVESPKTAAWTTFALFSSLYLNLASSCIEGFVRGATHPAMAAAGSALIAVKVLTTVWVMRSLGRQYSYNVATVKGHELVRSGPYAYCRHPMYSARMLATAGVALSFGAFCSLAVFILIDVLLIRRRVAYEEEVLKMETGGEYEVFSIDVGTYVPRLGRLVKALCRRS